MLDCRSQINTSGPGGAFYAPFNDTVCRASHTGAEVFSTFNISAGGPCALPRAHVLPPTTSLLGLPADLPWKTYACARKFAVFIPVPFTCISGNDATDCGKTGLHSPKGTSNLVVTSLRTENKSRTLAVPGRHAFREVLVLFQHNLPWPWNILCTK